MKKFILVLFTVLVFFVQPVFAEVITTQKTEGYANYVYIAGNADNYPIEYYDENVKSYKGVIPDLLEKISEYSGINFVYINGDKKDNNILGQNLQVDIVSSAGEITSYGKDYLELISYEQDGKPKKSGLIFTTLAKEDKITAIKSAANKISLDEKNGIYLSYASQNAKTNYKWLVGVIILSILLFVFVAILIIRIRRIRKENEADKMTDVETGMLNLQFFKV